MSVWLLSIAALDAADAAVTLRFASGAYKDPAHHLWLVRLQQPALFALRAFGKTLASAGRSGFGEAVLVNSDGGLDYLADYSVDGRLATLSLVTASGSILPVLVGTVQRLSWDGNKISVRLRDPQEALQLPHPAGVYAGNNALPAGLEGSSDIVGKQKPRVYGPVSNMQPVLVNTARYIYQASERTQSTITGVYVQGSALTAGATYSSTADMQANAPAGGQYRAYQGCFRVGNVPTGTVSCDVGDTTTTLLGDVFAVIAADAGATLLAADATALNGVGVAGLRIADATPTADLLDTLAASAGGYWAYSANGTLRARQLITPDVSPVLTLTSADIIEISRSATGSGDNGLPVWRVVLGADKVEDTQTDNVAIANAARLTTQFRQAIYESASTRTRHPLAATLEIDTALRSLADAQTQANRLGGLLSVRRDQVQGTARLSPAAVSALDIGITVAIKTKRLGYTAGRNFVVLGYELDAQRSRATLDLWG